MTRLRRLTAFAIVVCVALTCTSASALTEEQALSRATALLERLGHAPPQASPTAKLEETEFGPTWHVSLGPNLTAQIQDASGVVVHFSDWSAASWEAAASTITKDEAQRLATDYVKKVVGALPQGAELLRVTPGPGGSSAPPVWWLVTWIRRIGPYRVLDDGMAVDMDAQTGRLVGFGYKFFTPPPASMQPALTEAQAVDIAGRKAGGAPEESSQLVIVDPDHFRGIRPYGRRSTLAWDVRLADPQHTTVTVDGQTGEILSVSQSMGLHSGRVGTAAPDPGGVPAKVVHPERERPTWVWLASACGLLLAVGVVYAVGGRLRRRHT